MKLFNPKNISILFVIEYLIYIIFLIGLIWRGLAQAYYQTPLQWLDDFQWQSWFYRLINGEIPYKDFFVLYGPLLVYIFSIPFKLFGASFFSWNIIRYLFLPIICYFAAILVSKKIFKTRIFTIIFLLIASTYDAWGFFFLQPWMFRFWMGIFTLVIVFSRLKQKYFLTGIWLTLLFFSSIDQAIYVFITLLFMVILVSVISYISQKSKFIKLQSFRSFALGFVLFFTVTFLFLLLTGGLGNYLKFTFSVLPGMEVTSFGIVFPEFPINMLKTNLFSFIISKDFRYYLPILVYASYITISIRNFILQKKINWILIFLMVYGIFSFRTALGRSDFGHLMSVSVPAVYIILSLTEGAVQNLLHIIGDRKSNFLRILKAITLITVISGVFLFFYLTRSSIENGFLTLFNPNKIIKDRTVFADTYNPMLKVNISQEQSKSLNEAIYFLKSIPDKQFYEHGTLSGLHYLTDSKNIFYFDQDNWTTEVEKRKIIERLETENNQYAVSLSREFFFKGSLLNDYFNEYYDYYNQYGDLVIWKRNDKIFNANFSGMLVDSVWGQWQKTGTTLTYEMSLIKPMEINEIRIALELTYLPFLSFFAKTQVRLGVIDDINTMEWFLSDTMFVPKYSPDGQLNFHLYKNVRIKKLILDFSSPGGLNPGPVDIIIERMWLIK